jgi:hypothetical protein
MYYAGKPVDYTRVIFNPTNEHGHHTKISVGLNISEATGYIPVLRTN